MYGPNYYEVIERERERERELNHPSIEGSEHWNCPLVGPILLHHGPNIFRGSDLNIIDAHCLEKTALSFLHSLAKTRGHE
jgi:hypothetical protein